MARAKTRKSTSSFGPMWVTPSRGYKPPPVTKGADSPLPESRKEIVEKMLKELETKKAYRQNYSNGEFISSSTIVGLTLEDVANPKLELDGASYEAHYDPKLKVWWRRGGSFD